MKIPSLGSGIPGSATSHSILSWLIFSMLISPTLAAWIDDNIMWISLTVIGVICVFGVLMASWIIYITIQSSYPHTVFEYVHKGKKEIPDKEEDTHTPRNEPTKQKKVSEKRIEDGELIQEAEISTDDDSDTNDKVPKVRAEPIEVSPHHSSDYKDAPKSKGKRKLQHESPIKQNKSGIEHEQQDEAISKTTEPNDMESLNEEPGEMVSNNVEPDGSSSENTEDKNESITEDKQSKNGKIKFKDETKKRISSTSARSLVGLDIVSSMKKSQKAYKSED